MMKWFWIWVLALCAVACAPSPKDVGDADPPALQDSVAHYVALGPHRAGGDGDAASAAWIADELQRAGFSTRVDIVPVRQWRHEGAGLAVDGEKIDGFPLWWPPETALRRQAAGPLVRAGETKEGAIAVIEVAPQVESALLVSTRNKISQALEAGAAGVVLLTETASGNPFAFNAQAAPSPWPVPVLLVGSAHRDRIERAMDAGKDAAIAIDGAYEDAASRNVIGALKRGGAKTIVVSTPRTGWFTAGAERGPGLALFLDLARWASQEGNANLVFVATGAHELGHAGMAAFLNERAPSPSQTTLWLHLGSSIAAWNFSSETAKQAGQRAGENSDTRWVVFSTNMALPVRREFGALEYQSVPAMIGAFGEARDIRAAGYRRFVAFAGAHAYFHQPGDDSANTSGDLLAPRALALRRLLAPYLD